MSWTHTSGPTSPAAALGGFDAEDVYPGIFNLSVGGTNWRNAAAARGRTYDGTNLGGVCVLNLGDSTDFGYYAANIRRDAAFHLAKLELQPLLNPAGVEGGFGYIGFVQSATPRFDEQTFSGSWTDGSGGPGAMWVYASGTATAYQNRTFVRFNGASTNPQHRGKVTSLDVVIAQFANGATDNLVEVKVGADPIPADAGNLVSIAVNASGADDFGKRTAVTGLTPGNDNRLGISVGTNTGKQLFTSGVIAYHQDENAGVQFHNLAAPSRTLNSIVATSQNRIANFTRFGDQGGGGSRNCGAMFVSYGLNDIVSSSVALFESNLVEVFNQARAMASKPTVFVRIPMWSGNDASIWARPGGNSAVPGHPSEYAAVIYRQCRANADISVLIDLPRMFSVPYSQTMFSEAYADYAFGHADGIHYTSAGNRMLADRIFKACLLYGL